MFDIVILGGGPGGYVAADKAASLGMSVALVEKDALGGTCLNRGCIPTKSLLNSAKHYSHAMGSEAMGVKAEAVSFDLGKAMEWKNATVQRLVANIDFLMKKQKVEVFKGTGSLASAGAVKIAETGQLVEGKNIIIATGSVPARPPIPGTVDNPKVLTSDELLELKEMPKSIVVIGGGVIGMEFASFFRTLGVTVTVVEMMPEILPFMDAEICGVFKRSLKGMTIETSAAVTKVEGSTVHYKKGDEEKSVSGDLILLATGRRPALSGIGLEDLGIKHSPKGIEVDELCRTSVPGIWAIGDANGHSLLAHSASAMGSAVAMAIAGKEAGIPWEHFPWVVYGEPEAAGVGMTEADAQKAGIDYTKVSIPARANGRFLAENGMAAHGVAKLIAEKSSGRLLGVHIVAPYAGEMIWGFQYILSKGGTVNDAMEAVFPHPTVGELVHDALGALGL